MALDLLRGAGPTPPEPPPHSSSPSSAPQGAEDGEPTSRHPATRAAAALAGKAARLLSLLVAVTLAAYVLISASPVDPVQAYVGAEARTLSPEQVAQIEQRWGLDEPLAGRFQAWAGNVAQGDLGVSQIYGQPVTSVIAERLPATLALMGLAWVLSGLLGFALGLLAGYFRGRLLDRVLSWWAYVLASAPTFWVGLMLLYVFAVSLQWAPVCCAAPIGLTAEEVGLLDRLHHLILPALTVSLIGISPTLLHTRQATIEVLGSDHVRFSRSQGERGLGLVLHRVARNAAGPAIMVQFAGIGELFGGSILAEQVFTYPGLGEATTQAALRQDIPLLLGIALITAAIVFTGNLAGDLLHRWSDPRTRVSAR
ncbi:MAG: ABC transporter permease [Actinomycetia bacterium]|nr:ABC transporter permease [Actinomycetes bacterium]